MGIYIAIICQTGAKRLVTEDSHLGPVHRNLVSHKSKSVKSAKQFCADS